MAVVSVALPTTVRPTDDFARAHALVSNVRSTTNRSESCLLYDAVGLRRLAAGGGHASQFRHAAGFPLPDWLHWLSRSRDWWSIHV
jgi:hypothetical protein